MKLRKDSIKNILIIRRNNIGDMICAIPMFRTLRKAFSDARITVLAEESNAGIIEGASFIDETIVFKKSQGLFGNKYLGYHKLLKQTGISFDLVITAKAGFSSMLALISLISGARLRMGCVPDTWHPLKYCYNLPVKGCSRWRSLHQVDGLMEFIKTLGIETIVNDMSIDITPDSKDRAGIFLNKHGLRNNTVVFNISNNKPENTWPVEKFKETAGLISRDHDAAFIISSSPGDREKAVELSKGVANAYYYETRTVMDFAALVADSDLLICGEGGAMHVGSGVKTPTISLWGKLRPVKWTPYGEKQIVLKKSEHVDSISADDVLKAVNDNKLLK